MAILTNTLADGSILVAITAGTTEWDDPGNWNPANNKVEIISAGGRGGTGAGGGGGGAYAIGQNLDLTFPVSIGTLPADDINLNGYVAFGDYVIAPAGMNASGTDEGLGGSGGGVGGGIVPNGFPGGNGQDASGSPLFLNGSGGWAAGPWGAGADGTGFNAAGQGGTNNDTGLIESGASSGQGVWNAQFGGGGWGLIPGGSWLILITYVAPRTSTQIFLYDGVTRFPNPGNWNPNSNKVECVGMGGIGDVGIHGTYGAAGAGGGGGGYGWAINLNPTFPVTAVVPVLALFTMPIYTTSWASVSAACGGIGRCAPNGSSTQGGAGGSGSPNGSTGGTGGVALSMSTGMAAGGGGGAGGPNGVGLVGGAAVAPSTSGAGGLGDNGHTPAPPVPGAGTAGTQWDAIHGIGSGGSGGTAASPFGGVGGYFGGASGGAWGYNTTSPASLGGHALIVVTYTPAPPAGMAQIVA